MKVINVKIACTENPPLSKDFIWCHKDENNEVVYQIWDKSGYVNLSIGDLADVINNRPLNKIVEESII